MKFTALSVTAVISSVFTNWLVKDSPWGKSHQPSDHSLAKGFTTPASEAGMAQHIRDLEAELREMRLQREVQANSSNPISDMATSASQLQQFGMDLMSFALESSVAHLWPWPMEERLPTSTDSNSSETGPWSSLPDLHSAELFAQILDVVRGSFESLPDAFPAVGAAAWDSALTEVQAAVGAARQCFSTWLHDFAEQFPQHSKVLAGQDPLVIVLTLLGIPVVVSVGLYMFLRVLYQVAWSTAKGACVLLCCCCRCHHRGGTSEIQADAGDIDDKSQKRLRGDKGMAERIPAVSSAAWQAATGR